VGAIIKRGIKILFLLVVLAASFHLLGVESAFCNDADPGKDMSSHGCSMCHMGGHAAYLTIPEAISFASPVGFSFIELYSIRLQEPIQNFFRPPISL